ncbi:NAD(P)-dependent oxidoreductase [Rhodococcus tibetensis]|uniref:D-glycerate dehydrogenase n=1 Tax=Rhodococcus tibetensis TaxID=2965064 RepID=A0ABT1Q6R5_9NOCA|nr:NAD(P)-dependent oxidoreductase [Rhodococcus sp. FXJ9.536]MCQ4117935.1 D-glycerate dehydrogenase [Rhodococcus sp. FXJ9.536]
MNRARFYVTTPIPEPALTLLRGAGSVDVPDELPDAARLREVCVSGDYDVVVSQLRDTFDADLLAAAKIRGISNYAVGFNNVDIGAATANSILVGNTPGVLTDATADVAMLLIMATAKRALAYGMQVLFCPRPPGDRPVPDEELGEFAGLVTHTDWDTLVTTSDYLSLHVPLNAQTRHLVDAGVLAAMKPSAILINTARGPVVDETALVAALKSGEIAGAGLDVYEDEPALAPGLAELSNTVLLPHLGSATVSVRAEMARLCAENAVAMAQNRIPPHPVNPEAWNS